MVLKNSALAIGLLSLLLSACQPLAQRPPAPTTEAGSGASPAPAMEREQSVPPVEAPDNAREAVDALRRQSEHHLSQGDWQAAINASEHGLRLNRRYAPFYRLLGQSYRQKGDLQTAREFARQALRYCGQNCEDEQALMESLSQ